MKLMLVVEKISKAIEETKGAVPSAATKCQRCNADLMGQRMCPKCGEDSWALEAKRPGSSSSIISK